MLKYIFVLLFVVSSLSYTQEIAVPEPCTSDCSALEWSPVQVTQMKDCCRGSFTIYWVYRNACNGLYQDIQLLKIESYYPKCVLPCLAIGYTQEDRFKSALKYLIGRNPMGFNPQVGTTGCSSTWRVSEKSCWADFKINKFNPTAGVTDTLDILVACDSSECCLTNMKVCRRQDQYGREVIELTNLGATQNVYCNSSVQIGSQIQSCNGICDWLFPNNTAEANFEYSLDDWDIVIGKEANALEKDNYQFGVNIFNTHESLSMEIFSDQNYTTKLEIYDIQGKLISEKSINLSSGVQKINFNNSEFKTNSTYLYSFTYNGLIINNGKFIK